MAAWGYAGGLCPFLGNFLNPALADLLLCGKAKLADLAKKPVNQQPESKGGDVYLAILAILLFVCSASDLIRKKVPNIFTYPTMLVAFALHLFDSGFAGLANSLQGLGVGMAVLLPFFFGGMIGAGDVKLLGAVGAILGPVGAFCSFLFTGLAGGVYALISLCVDYTRGKAFISRYVTMMKILLLTGQFAYIPATEAEKKVKLCYGIAIAIGTLCYVSLNQASIDNVLHAASSFCNLK